MENLIPAFNPIPAFNRHHALQYEWIRIVRRGGRAEPRLTGIEDELRKLRDELRANDVQVLPPLMDELLFLSTDAELYELHEKLVRWLVQHGVTSPVGTHIGGVT